MLMPVVHSRKLAFAKGKTYSIGWTNFCFEAWKAKYSVRWIEMEFETFFVFAVLYIA